MGIATKEAQRHNPKTKGRKMTIYYVTPADATDAIDFASLSAAKAYIRKHPGSTGVKDHVSRDGSWEPVGEIVLRGSNAYRFHNANGRDRTVAAY